MQAQSDGFDWICVDACFIDGSSSPELSEAINSTYQTHANVAAKCYAYLADVHTMEDTDAPNSSFRKISGSRGRCRSSLLSSTVKCFALDWKYVRC